jgi:2-iminobutanoate/2-iminopropanoate deaminase
MVRFMRSLCVILLVLGVVLIIFGHGSQLGETAPASPGKEIIILPGAKPSGHPFSSAVKVGNTMFVSGVVGTDVKTNQLISDDVADQTRLCLEKLKAIVTQGGMNLADAVNCTVYLADINDYDAMNKVYATFFPTDPPARACVQVAKLVRGAKVEISMIAIKAK